jgi:exodeoxyribonuclease VIII
MTMTEIPTGYWQCTNDEYHARKDLLGSTMLKDAMESLALFNAKHVAQTIPREEKEDWLIGSLTHWIVLDHTITGTALQHCPYVVAPKCDRRTTAGKQLYADFCVSAGDRQVLTDTAWNTAWNCARSILADDKTMHLLQPEIGIVEQALVWRDHETGLPCKCKPDYRRPDLVVDLKTCQNAKPDKFIYDIGKLKYHAQAAHYLTGIDAVEGYEPERRWVFIAVSKNPPYEVSALELDQESIDAGRELNSQALRMIAEAKESGDWRSDWQKQTLLVSLNRYHLTNLEIEA